MNTPVAVKKYHANRIERDKNAKYRLYNPITNKILFAHDNFNLVADIMSTAYMQRARTKLEIVKNPDYPKTVIKAPR